MSYIPNPWLVRGTAQEVDNTDQVWALSSSASISDIVFIAPM